MFTVARSDSGQANGIRTFEQSAGVQGGFLRAASRQDSRGRQPPRASGKLVPGEPQSVEM
eukprot:7042195-Alexandrium_andersonii.AAC.1